MSASITTELPMVTPPITTTPETTTPATTTPTTTTTPASTTSSAAASDSNALTNMDKWSIAITFAAAVALGIVAYISAGRGWWIGIAAACGALGGLVHEMAQSGGKILFFERKSDGFYLGAM